jgi:A/G-specific adenine glycosylase
MARRIVEWYEVNKRDLPWRRKPYCDDPCCVYVSEIMLQQTQVKTVIPYWERWMRELPTIRALAEAAPERVLKLWEGLGYYSRARNLQAAAREIVARHGGVFPEKFEAILELPGIGRYTAGAIASIAFGQAAPLVDGNVARVLCRYLGLRGDPKSKETSAALWEAATKLVQAAHEEDACSELNQGMMELGAMVCLPREPRCGECPVRSGCFAFKNKCVGELPEVAPRAKTTARVFRAVLIVRVGKVFLRQRPAGVVNAGFWELPNLEAKGESARETVATLANSRAVDATGGGRSSAFGRSGKREPAKAGTTNPEASMANGALPQPLCVIKHSITRYRMTLEVYRADASSALDGKWFSGDDLKLLPMVNAHRKALLMAGLLPLPRSEAGKSLMELE